MTDAKPNQSHYSVLGSFVLPVAHALRNYGLEPLSVLEQAGIDPAKAANPAWRIAHTKMSRLMELAEQLSGDEAFGLRAAEELQPQVLRALGLAWLASDTVYDGLQRLARFGEFLSTGFHFRLEREGALVYAIMERLPALDATAPAGRDYGVGIVVRMCRLTLGEFLAPVSIEMDRAAPAEPERWEYMLATRVSFGAPVIRIAWAYADIVDPLVTGDPMLARVNDEQTQAYLDAFQGQATCRQVVDRIVERLPDGPPSQVEIASDLHVSNRTLQRKLKEEGTSFVDLLRDTRLQLARKYLAQPSRSVVETAYLLGFSEPSTFSRAFKRWTGLAPAEYRENSHPR
jgi:AraC-like DNA-binding protein